MLELLLVACVGLRQCEYVASPITYPTEARCAHNAALIAGTVRGRYASTWSHRYRFTCRPADGSGGGEWIAVELPVEPDDGPDRVVAFGKGAPVRP